MDHSISTDDHGLDFAQAKEAAETGPVILTEGGRPSLVLLTYEDYQRLKKQRSLADALRDDRPEADFEFEPPRLSDNMGFKIPTFDD